MRVVTSRAAHRCVAYDAHLRGVDCGWHVGVGAVVARIVSVGANNAVLGALGASAVELLMFGRLASRTPCCDVVGIVATIIGTCVLCVMPFNDLFGGLASLLCGGCALQKYIYKFVSL